ncbi:MAG: hypothetical protein HXY49_11975 [Ignavibacteriaceae bacterium]|jgi:hypothetical protein|nr:hypothetical protein [Ignavibacterium sp.]NWF51245.1 hypothetical protein [Ignavibacteriaceae bacterium]
MNKNFYISVFIVFFTQIVNAQSDSLFREFHLDRMNINENAMLILGSWAVGNILVGTYGNFKTTGEAKYFHQFNAMWNVVNLGIAAFGYFNAANSDPSSITNLEIIKDYNSLQNFLLLNAGLDVAYIATGLYLKERSKNSSSSERLRGYGNSLLLQGGFLLLFDVSLFFIHQNNANINLYPHLESFLAGGVGIGINLKL